MFKYLTCKDNSKHLANLDPRNEFFLYDNFTGSLNNSAPNGAFALFTSAANGGNIASGTSSFERNGVVRAQTSTATNGRCAFMSAADSYLLGDRDWEISTYLRFPNLTDATNNYNFFWGFAELPSSSIPDKGIFFRYSTANTNWQCINRRVAAQETLTNTSVAIATSSWYKLDIFINKALTTAIFAINDVVAATHANATNFPTTSNPLGLIFWIQKTAGVLNRAVEIDDLSMYWKK